MKLPAATDRLPGRPAAWLPGGVVFAIVFILYAITACRTVGPGDSGELTAVMCTWGVAHAPGYPLLSLLGNLVSHLPHPGEPAFILNLLSALFGAAAAGVVGLAVTTLTGDAAAGAVAGLALGASRVFWEYSLVVEVFPLNSLCATLLLWCLARFLRGLRDRQPVAWPLPAAALVTSAVITHHTTLVLVAAPVLLTFVAAVIRPGKAGASNGALTGGGLARVLLISAAAAAAGLLPLLYLPLAARGDPALNWDNPATPAGLVRLLMRKDYGSGTLMSPWAVATTVLEHGEKAAPPAGIHFWRYWAEIPRNFGWVFPILPLLGIAWAVLRERRLAVFVALFLAMLALFFARVNSPLLPLYLGVTERFYILPNVVMAFLAGLGLAWLGEMAGRLAKPGRAAGARAPVLRGFVYAAAAAMTGLAMIPVNGPEVSMRGNTFTRDLGANLLAGMPADAILLSEGDLYHNAFYYQQACLGRRPDIEFIDEQKLTYPWYVEQVRRRGVFRLPEEMKSYSLDARTHCKAWLDLNMPAPGGENAGAAAPGGGAGGPAPGGNGARSAARPIVAVSLMDRSWYSDYRLQPVGLWWLVRRKGEVPQPAAQAAMANGVAAQWLLTSLDRRGHERSWEEATGPTYPRALAAIGAMNDLAGDIQTGKAPLEVGTAAAGWFDRAEKLARGDRALVLTVRVETLHRAMADGGIDYGALGGPAPLIRKAIGLAEEAVRIDSTSVGALQSLATLMRADPSTYSRRREAEVRRLVAQQLPGSAEAVGAYVQLVIDLAGDPATRDILLLRDAVARERRLLDLLETAIRLCPEPSLQATRDQWREYLRRTEEMLARR